MEPKVNKSNITKEQTKVNAHQEKNGYESQLSDWINRERSALALVKLTGQLWYDKSVELVIFRRPLFDRRAITLVCSFVMFDLLTFGLTGGQVRF